MLGIGLGFNPTKECGIFSSTRALQLDGNSDYVNLPSAFNSLISRNQMTISFWVNMVENDGSTSQIIFETRTDSDNLFKVWFHKYYTEWRVALETDGTTRNAVYDIPGSSNNDGSGYGDGWVHFAGNYVISGGSYSVRIYRNGSLIQNTAGESGQSDWEGSIAQTRIGANQDGSNAFVDGNIDQLAVWNVALPDTAITAIYNGGVMRDLTTHHPNYTQTVNLIGYYQFEGNVNDSSKNGNHGTLVGTAGFSNNQP